MKISTFKEIKLKDESKVKLTLNFNGLNNVRTMFPDIYKWYSNISLKGINEELDFVAIIYTAYLCANYKDKNVMTEEQFFDLCPENRRLIYDLAGELMYPEKN